MKQSKSPMSQDEPLTMYPKGAHLLRGHLSDTADRAAQFAAELGSDGWGRLAGLWHDLGKYFDDFKRHVRAAPRAIAAIKI